jgi:hypothetical protein
MKKLFSILLTILFMFPYANAKMHDGGPILSFERTEIDFGTIEKGADPYRKFKFKNTGTAPLIIKEALSSCGCTVPKFNTDPVMPGESGILEVRYDTHHLGSFTKAIIIKTNEAIETRTVIIRGTVVEKTTGNGGLLTQKKK